MKRVERNRENYRNHIFLELVFRAVSVIGKVLVFVLSFAIVLVHHSLTSYRNRDYSY